MTDSKGLPKRSSTKEQMRSWLSRNNYPWREDMLRSELLVLCERLAPAPQFCLDQLASEFGHSILRTPQYHPELQPIESCWAVVKNYMADNCDFTVAGMKKRLPEAFAKVTSGTCKKIMREVIKEEKKYWQEDEELDERFDGSQCEEKNGSYGDPQGEL